MTQCSVVQVLHRLIYKSFFRENPDVVFLQEVVPASEEIIAQKCPQYEFIPGGDIEYYTAIMLKRSSVERKSFKVTPFPNSVMMRNIITVSVIIFTN